LVGQEEELIGDEFQPYLGPRRTVNRNTSLNHRAEELEPNVVVTP